MADFLYIHIPFCIQKCVYCDFFSVAYEASIAGNYIDALCKELSLRGNVTDTLKTVYIGGGTPTLLPDECFGKLFPCLRNRFNLPPSAEITVEANPGTLDEAKIRSLLLLGVNRLSIGAQSFHDHELKALGRIHSSDEAMRSIEAIKKSGVENFSIDLMYGIPGQTMDSWRDSLSKAIELSPTHISAYELTPEKGTPLYGSLESGKMRMPDEELVLGMYHHTIDYLTGIGYDHYEISNFALPGFRCIHNLNYWDRGEYLGAGAGAHSFLNGVRSQNSNDIKGYIDNLTKGIIPESASNRLTPEEAVRESIFLGLRKREGINLNKIPHIGNPPPLPLPTGDTGRHSFSVTKEMLLAAGKELIAEGYLESSGDSLRLTGKGLVISNTIIVMLFEKLGL